MSRPPIIRDDEPRLRPTGTGAEPQNRSKCVIEVAEILAAGLMRAIARKSSRISPPAGESSLDFTPIESGHPTQIGSEKRK
jgi:hypothetical protein